MCIGRKGPDHGGVQCLSSLWGKWRLPEDPRCDLVHTVGQCRVQSAEMGFNTDFGCLGLGCLSFTPCRLHFQFWVG